MASLELSAEEQWSQGRRSAVCNIVSHLSGESVLDILGDGRDWHSLGVAFQFIIDFDMCCFISAAL